MLAKLRRLLPRHVRFVLRVYFTGLVALTLFRVILFATGMARFAAVGEQRFVLLPQAFLMGLRFDTVISGYMLALPLLALSISEAVGFRRRLYHRGLTLYLGTLYTLAFAICVVDIPYFNQFFAHVSVTVLNWASVPGYVVATIAQEPRFAAFVPPFIIVTGAFLLLLRHHRRATLGRGAVAVAADRNRTLLIVVSVLACAVLVGATRGRLTKKSPIRVGTAYFSNDPFMNQLGLSPVFTFVRSGLDALKPENAELRLMDDELAIAEARRELGVADDSRFASPIARQVSPQGPPVPANVVVVLMEAMSAQTMSRYGNDEGLTPHLDRLATEGLTFDRIYSAGIHTYNGIYSTLVSYPALKDRHPMKAVSMPRYSGLADTLRDQGYRTLYFSANDVQFNNAGGFLRANGLEDVFWQKDYPADRILSTLGAPDDYLLEFAANQITETHAEGRPFLAFIRTASLHGPWIVPEWADFEPRSTTLKKQVIEYADWSIRQFLVAARQQEWFDNTLFVFVADHGLYMTSTYDMALALNHTPLIFYGPKILKKPRGLGQIGGQIDVFPTIMGLLNMPYVNNTLGIDLFKQRRPYAYFVSDGRVGVIDKKYFLVMRDGGDSSLYRYNERDTTDYIAEQPERAAAMRAYAYSMMQTAQWVIGNEMVGPQQLTEQ